MSGPVLKRMKSRGLLCDAFAYESGKLNGKPIVVLQRDVRNRAAALAGMHILAEELSPSPHKCESSVGS